MDRLGPLASLIRTLWQSRAEQAPSGQPDPGLRLSPGNAGLVPPVPAPPEDLRDRLRRRMAALSASTPERRCQAFVETVLITELTDGSSADPRFGEIVSRVSGELRADPRIAARLDELMDEVQAGGSP